jgi:hypothetical protein
VRFNVPEGCERPCDIPELNNSDNRCLSVRIQNLTIYERKDGKSLKENNFDSGKELHYEYISGWHDPENWNEITTLWMGADAVVAAYSEENRDAVLIFQAQSFARPRSLEISLGDLSPANFSVDINFTNITRTIQLIKGCNLIRLHVPEGCERPCDIPKLNSNDCRCISIAVQKMDIIKK